MKLIKKIFPNYKTKKELKEEIRYLNFCKRPKIEIKKATTQEYIAHIGYHQYHEIPEEFILDGLSRQLSKELKNVMHVEKYDDNYTGKKIYVGKIEVVLRWENDN